MDKLDKVKRSYQTKKKKNWIAGAIKHPGSLKKSAKKAHTSTMEFAREHMHDSGITGNRARLAMTLGRLRK